MVGLEPAEPVRDASKGPLRSVAGVPHQGGHPALHYRFRGLLSLLCVLGLARPVSVCVWLLVCVINAGLMSSFFPLPFSLGLFCTYFVLLGLFLF